MNFLNNLEKEIFSDLRQAKPKGSALICVIMLRVFHRLSFSSIFLGALLTSMFASSGYAFFGKGVESISRPDAEKGPTQIETAIFVLDVNSVNTQGQSFAANIFMTFRWKDLRLAHEAKGFVSYQLDEVWNPRLQIINRQNIWEAIDPVAEVASDGTVTVRYS